MLERASSIERLVSRQRRWSLVGDSHKLRPVPAPEPAPPFRGTERFELVGELGAGAMGIVYEARDRERDVRVALKGLRMRGADDVLRLKREFRALRDLRHPNLVRLDELIEHHGQWLLSMELLDGVDFLEWLGATPDAPTESGPRRRRPRAHELVGAAEGDGASTGHAVLDEARLRDALAQLASGLDALHAHGVVHRDVKPSNVLVERSGRVVLLDFGMVAALAHETDVGAMVGTLSYMAPEQALGRYPTPAADWYAVGVLLYRALAGVLPYEARSADELVEKKVEGKPRALSELTPAAPRDLAALALRLLAPDPRERPSGAEVLAALGVQRAEGDRRDRAARPFIGRQHELGLLGAAFERAREGEVLVLVEGASGVGKTVLADELVAHLRREHGELWALRGRCHERESVPFKAFDGLIDQLGQLLEDIPAELTERFGRALDIESLIELFPTLRIAHGLGAHASRHADLVRRRESAFGALKGLLRRIGRRYPLVLVLDDFHWADADSIALLTELRRGADAPHALFVVLSRPMGGERAGAALAGAEVHTLGGLTDAESLALLHAIRPSLGTTESIDEDAVVREAGGHPMFLQELTRGAHVDRSGGAHLDDAIRARVASLPAEAREIVELLAVAGAPIPNAVVPSALGLPPEVLSGAEALLEFERLVRLSGTRRRDTIEPYHDRIREAVLHGLSEPRARELHSRLARSLASSGAPARTIALHHEGAGHRDEARASYRVAAEDAIRTLAFASAAGLYQRALDLGPSGDEERRLLLVGLATACALAGRQKEAGEGFLRAADTGEVDPSERIDLMRQAADAFLKGGYLVEGRRTMRSVLEANGIDLPIAAPATFLWIVRDLARLAYGPLRWAQRAEDAIDPRTRRLLDLYWSVGHGLAYVDTVVASHFTHRGSCLSLEAGEPSRIARALCASSVTLSALGARRVSLRLAEASHVAAEQSGSDMARFFAQASRVGYDYYIRNDWPESLRGTERCEELLLRVGHQSAFESGPVDLIACRSLGHMGRLAELEERVSLRVRASEATGDRFIPVTFRSYFVHGALARDAWREARQDIRDAIATWPESAFGNQHFYALRGASHVALYAGAVDEDELDRRWALFDAALVHRLAIYRLDAELLRSGIWLERALRAAAAGDSRAKRAHLREARRAAERLDRIELPAARLHALVRRAALALFDGRSDVAIAALREAADRALESQTLLLAHALRWWIGVFTGDARLLDEAEAWMRERGIQRPDRFARAEAPGFGLLVGDDA